MKKLIFLLLLIFPILSFCIRLQGSTSQANNGPVTTIRNATKQTLTYLIKEADFSKQSQEKYLNIGEIHRYQGGTEYLITFLRNEKSITMLLKPDTPFVFRLDAQSVLQIYPGSHSRNDAEDLAPFVPTPMEIVEKMLAMVRIKKNDLLYDLGCGDGRIVIKAAQQYGIVCVGIDIDPQLIRQCEAKARIAEVDNLVIFIEEDIFKVDISRATVVTIFLLTESNDLLRPKLESELKPGVFVICHNYPIPGWETKLYKFQSCSDRDGNLHSIYLYRR